MQKIQTTMEKKYKCEHCDQECSRSDTMRNHVKNEHDSAATKLHYLCPICEKSFKYRSNWTAHMKRAHGMTDEKVKDEKNKGIPTKMLPNKKAQKSKFYINL